MMSGEQASSGSLTWLRNNSALAAATASTTLRARMHRNRLMMRMECKDSSQRSPESTERGMGSLKKDSEFNGFL